MLEAGFVIVVVCKKVRLIDYVWVGVMSVVFLCLLWFCGIFRGLDFYFVLDASSSSQTFFIFARETPGFLLSTPLIVYSIQTIYLKS
jgi:hypothetical protein